MLAALVLLVVAGSTGMEIYNHNTELTSRLTQARAVLHEDAQVVSTGDLNTRFPVWVQASWTDRTGTERTGKALVRESAPAGTEVDVWLDPDGKVSPIGFGRDGAATLGILSAVMLLLGGSVVLGLVWHGARRVTGAFNARRWEREWARVGPDWTGRPL
jgi:hypothetical protein